MEVTPFGKYLLLKKLAVGGMAEIFLAKQAGLAGFEKLVVIKRILPEMAADQDFVKMFLDEARLAASMSHPNVVQIFDLNQADGTLYIAMEYIAGQDLSHIIKACKKAGQPVPVPILARIMVGACEGLHYAHTMKDARGQPLNLVHRDVTPSNIYISYEGASKVLDFGVAKAESQMSKTQAGTLKGKFPFMAPEQIRLEKLDARVDVWALGVVLWEMLVGKRLFNAENELGVMRAILDMPIQPPSQLRSDVPKEIDEICLKALARDLDKRYASGQAMQRDLEAYLRTLPNTTTTLEVSAFMKQVFAAEYTAFEKLLTEIPNATPEQLAGLLEHQHQEKTQYDSGDSFSRSTPGTRGTPPPTPMPEPKGKGGMIATVLALLALLGGGAFYYFNVLAKPVLGEVEVRSEPSGADIYFDGKKLAEKTPAILKQLTMGKHEIKLEMEGREAQTNTFILTETRPAVAVALALPENKLATGRLAINTNPPGARIWLDGDEQMRSPVDPREVAPNVPHRIRAELAGFQQANRTEKVAPGQLKQVMIELERIPQVVVEKVDLGKPCRSNGQCESGYCDGVCKKRPSGGNNNQVVNAPSTKGWLIINSTSPACELVIDGERVGSAPAKKEVAGTASVECINGDLGFRYTTQFDVPAGGKIEKAIVVSKGKMAFAVEPWADVFLGDKKLGTTPMAPREFYEGIYNLRLVNSELGAIRSVRVQVKAGQVAVIRETLQ